MDEYQIYFEGILIDANSSNTVTQNKLAGLV